MSSDKGVPISEWRDDSERKLGFQQQPFLGSLLRTRGCRQDTGLTRILHKPSKHHVSLVSVTLSHLTPSQAAAVVTFPLLGVRYAMCALQADFPTNSKGVTSQATSRSQTALLALARNPATQLLPVRIRPATPTDVTYDRSECSSTRLEEAEDTGCHRPTSVCFRCSRLNFTL